MTVKLVDEAHLPGICVNDMRDGQMGVVVAWKALCQALAMGRIVQRDGSDAAARLIAIGEPQNLGWLHIFETRHEDCRVRLLEPPERIEMVAN